ncbi:MAG: HAD-IIA family hydrolase [archaeon]|nr:HAD-IIA family hydrolase [archaeon]
MIKNVLLDVDGVLIYGDKKILGADKAIEFLEKNGYNYLLVTNVSRYTAQELSKLLLEQGLKVHKDKISGPIEAIIGFVKSKKRNPKCFLIGSNQVKKEFRKAGVKVTEKEEKADFVVVFLYNKTSYKMLDIAFRLLIGGAELVTSSMSKTFPEKNGKLAMGTGPFVKGLEFCSGKKAHVAGKPNKEFFLAALSKLHAKPQETLMVGDTLDADVFGAKNTGIKAVLVKTGNFSQQGLEKSVLKPDYVIESVAELPALLRQLK